MAEIFDLDLSKLERKKIRINGDDSRILEINTSDAGIAIRLEEAYPKLIALERRVSEAGSDAESGEADTMDDIRSLSSFVREVDTEMRGLLDFIFDANVSSVCAPSGSMLDPIDGQTRYEHIITALTGLYNDTLEAETRKIRDRIKTHTAKYTKPAGYMGGR